MRIVALWVALALTLTVLFRCTISDSDPDELVRHAASVAGMEKLENGRLEFLANGKKYSISMAQGELATDCFFSDSTSTIHDILNKKGFMRTVDSLTEILPDTVAGVLAEKLRTEVTWMIAPIGLQAPEIRKTHFGKSMIHGRNYLKIGFDYEPEVACSSRIWFDMDTYAPAFIAIKGSGWSEFRQARNRRLVDGLVVQDYQVYRAPTPQTAVDSLDLLFQQGKLVKSRLIEIAEPSFRKN